MEKPEVDSIEGLSPAISIEQKTTSRIPRSTVGTVTEIYDYFRVLFARIGIPHCPSCGRVISAQTVQQMVDRVMSQPVGTRLLVLAPVIRGRKGEYKKLFFDLRRQGYSRVRVNGVLRELTDEIDLDKNRKHTIEVLVDRLVVRATVGSRLADSLATALRLADGVVQVEPLGDADWSVPAAQIGGSGGSGTRPPVKQSRASSNLAIEPMLLSERLACPECGISLPEVSPRMFSFNSPYGACETCSGLGSRWEVDPERVVPNAERTLKQGALAPWAGHESPYFKQTLAVLAKRYKFTLDTSWKSLKKSVRDVILDSLTLDRPAGTLSGGEGQRIRLATQIGSSLVGVLYILDEPSIGLHQRDNRRLLETLKRLRDLGNTVLVVEHDEETIKHADYVVDLGPGAGELGGHVVAIGTPDEIRANPSSRTGRYLRGNLEIPVP